LRPDAERDRRPCQGHPHPEAELERYVDLTPEGLREVWPRDDAAMLMGDGRFQFCDPAPMRAAALAPWFEGDAPLSIDRLVPFAWVMLTTGETRDGWT
jgi:hypothetical protein